MKLLSIIKHTILNFRRRYRFSVRNPHNNEEVWYMFISPMKTTGAFISLTFFMFVAVMLIVSYTPIMDLLPGYPGHRSRMILIENVKRLDSLEQQMRMWEYYRNNINLIMEGKTPVSISASSEHDSVKKKMKYQIINLSKSDSLFRLSMVTDSEFAKKHNEAKGETVRSFELFQPVKGVVKTPFSVSNSTAGITISVAGRQDVMAVTDGTVILSSWSPSEGNIVQIQHGGNMISTYKQLSQVLVKKGSRVNAGEVIGYAGGESENNKSEKNGTITFELWDSGSPIDPEQYIVF